MALANVAAMGKELVGLWKVTEENIDQLAEEIAASMNAQFRANQARLAEVTEEAGRATRGAKPPEPKARAGSPST